MFADFVISSPDVAQCPATGLPEYAFIGRSNVGKSSLINMLTQKKGLAKTSQKPGKTLLINHFIVDKRWYLVDLPGYGFAQAGKTQREKLRRMIERYCLLRAELTTMFVLLDSRLEPQTIDLEFIDWLGGQNVPFALVFTKIDKLNKSQLAANIKNYEQKLYETWEELPPIFLTSSATSAGREELLEYIESINASLNK